MTSKRISAAFDTWVFDLDNTLYPAECDLFAQIDARMTAYVSALLQVDSVEARLVQKRYYFEYGTTLAGLMAQHAVDPHDFLHHVHDIDVSPITPDPELLSLIEALPGKRLVFTNGSHAHASRVVARLGLEGAFDDYFDIAAAGFAPKPQPIAFDRLIAKHNFAPAKAIMFEDMARNLAPAAAIGMTTVLVRSTKDWSHEPEGARPAGPSETAADHVHHVTDCLKAFLRAVPPQPVGV
jgi:putative hydrolase of the HAD superfamily